MMENPDTAVPKRHFWQTIAGVDVWRFSLDCDSKTALELRTLLIAEEIQRADRFFTEQLRTRFVVGRATARIILSGYLADTLPERIEFVYGSHGKPSLKATDLRFNLAHSNGLGLLAVTKGCDVGIDLEWIDKRVEIEDIAERFFTRQECSEMMSHSGTDRSDRFFDLWCCKEAYLKATGEGISGGLNQCRIVDAADGTASIHNPNDSEAAKRWRIHRLQPGSGFAGALCVEI